MKSPILITTVLVSLTFAGCGKKEATTPAATNAPAKTSASSGNPLTAPVDYLGAVGRSKTIAQKTVDTGNLNRAVQAFQAGEGRLPTSLDELVTEKYLPKLPPPPYGAQYQYDPQTGAVRFIPKS